MNWLISHINELNHNITDKLNEIPAIDINIKKLQNEKNEILALKDENEIKKRIFEIFY